MFPNISAACGPAGFGGDHTAQTLRLCIGVPYDRAAMANIRRRPTCLMSFNPTLLTISIFAYTLAVAGCAGNPAQRDVHSARHKVSTTAVHAPARTLSHSEQRRYPERRIHLPDAALLTSQPAPDCAFKGASVDAMDATELARLKIEYERQCYQNAEKAARDRLSVLQGAVQHMRD